MFYRPKLADQPGLDVASLASPETPPAAAVRKVVLTHPPVSYRVPHTLLLSVLLHAGFVGLLAVAMPIGLHSGSPQVGLDTVLLRAPLEIPWQSPLEEAAPLPAPEVAFPEWNAPAEDVLEPSLNTPEEPLNLKAPDLVFEAETVVVPVVAQWNTVKLPVAHKPTPVAPLAVPIADNAGGHGGGGGGAGPAMLGTGGVASGAERGNGVGTGTGSGTGAGAGSGRGTGWGARTGAGSGTGTGSGVGDGHAPGRQRSGGATKGAALLSTLSPAYPDAQRLAGRTAVVLLEVLVNEKGHAQEIRVLSGDEKSDFANAALKEARKARYAPALEDGQAVLGYLRIKVEFRLK